jgi:hypothetical protein
MGMLDGILGKRKPRNYILTELGKTKADQMAGNEGITLKILSHLEENGESNSREIAERYGYSEKQIQAKLEVLRRKDGWVDLSKN